MCLGILEGRVSVLDRELSAGSQLFLDGEQAQGVSALTHQGQGPEVSPS